MQNIYNPNHIEEKVFSQVGVKAIVLNSENKILLLKRSDKMRRSAGKWSLPGGGINLFENPKDTVVREIREN
jgi:ADP-ribose pyrophosphatase YjhB (NUDIX family)